MGCHSSKSSDVSKSSNQNHDQSMTSHEENFPVVVSIDWLSGKFNDGSVGDIRILDVSWHMPQTKRDPVAEYGEKHIPGALLLDLNTCKDTSSELEMMLPSADTFAEHLGKLGVDNDTHVVLYDNNEKLGMFSAPRAWYMFRVFGHDKVSVLNGGLPKWIAGEHPTTGEIPDVQSVKYSATFRQDLVKDREDVQSNMSEKRYTLVDARPPGRFKGEDPEPVPNIKSGHIKGTINIPFSKTLDPDTKEFKKPDQLQALFNDNNVDLKKPLALLCGTGLTASFLALAAYYTGKADVPIYDGAWMEWFLKADADTMENVPE